MNEIHMLGPESVAWRIHADPAGLVGGIRSLMVQALHPRAMAGVAQHSEFRTDFWGRLRRTSEFLATLIYGSREEVERNAAVVRAVHARIAGIDDFTGKPYAASDPDLLVWVAHATVESYLTAYGQFARPLSRSDADRYVSEMRILGQSMGVARSDLASDVAGLRAYFQGMRPQLAASPVAKEAVRILLNPELPLQLRPLWRIPAFAAASSLPPSYRAMYGLSSLQLVAPVARGSAQLLLVALRVFLPAPPIVEEARAKANAIAR